MACRTEYYRSIGTLLTGAPFGEQNPRWKGGRFLHQGKYWLVLRRDHPRADRHGYVRQSHLVMEEHIGRYLQPGEVVHHINRQTTDDRFENLQLFESNGLHKHIESQQARTSE